MRKTIYYIIPILVAGATYIGRLFWFGLCLDLDAFTWINDRPMTPRAISGTVIFILSALIPLLYLIFMYRKSKKRIKYSIFEQILVVVAIALFVEIGLNGLLIFIGMGNCGGMLAVGYFITYLITIPLALVVSYKWIAINNKSVSFL